MPRYFQLDRLTTDTASHVKPIIFDADAILTAQDLYLYDKEQHTHYHATEISLLGYPEYTFRTLLPIADLYDALGGGVLSLTGFNGPASCSIPGGPYLVGIKGSMPMVTVNRVRNKIKSLTEEVMLNPNFIMYVDTIKYLDDELETEQTGARIVLNSTPPKAIPTDLPLSAVADFLQPTLL